MSNIPAIADQQKMQLGPGRLVLVVGPSGAGKDTLIDLARTVCADNERIVFARRVVTREATSFENNLQVSPAAFADARARGAFAVDWTAHGLHYALPIEIDDDIRAGRTVVANISRSVIAPLRERYADVAVVLITAPPEILAARLSARARGSDGPVENRLRRSGGEFVAELVINNVGAPDGNVGKLLDLLRSP